MEPFFEKSLHTLEFIKVLNEISDGAVSDKAKENVLNLRPKTSEEEVSMLLEQTFFAVGMIERRSNPPISKVTDIGGSVRRAEIGSALSIREILETGRIVKTARLLLEYYENDAQSGILDSLFLSLSRNKYLEEKIEKSFISEEEVSDEASSELRDIRRKIKNAHNKVRDVLNKFMSSSTQKKYLQEPIITMRSGRYVVPVRSEYKQMVPGLLHDTSQSGATLFIEPSGVIEANNEIRALQSDEQAEIERILYEISGEIASFGEDILASFQAICALDEIFARAKYSLKIKGVRPKLNSDGNILFKNARHPLLDKKTVVPITIELGGSFDTLIVTGPNTGGKTVALKTLGLLCALFQSGIFLPVSEGSSAAVFSNIFADIGDEQSIEQSLSTFSSHLKNIRIITETADDRTLALFDELGAGTDPEEGAALAIAIIEYLRERKVKIAATTHYGEMKLYALKEKGVENASCEFDVESLRPTYKLLIGVPGKSNALAISERLGLSKDIIDRAKKNVKKENVDFEDILGQMEKDRIKARKAAEDTEELKREIEGLKGEVSAEKKRLEKEQNDLKARAKQDAQRILANARREAEEIFSELERLKKEKDEQMLGEKLALAKGFVKNKLSKAEGKLSDPVFKKVAPPLKRDLTIGDNVILLNLGKKASVLTLPDKNGNLMVQAGVFKISSNIKEVVLDEDPQKEKVAEFIKSRQSFENKTREVKNEIDVRGQNTEEAILEIAKFLDNAVLMGLHTATIIHGKGTGVLRKNIHDWLKGNKLVRTFRLGVYGEGEDGITIVELK